MSKGAKRSVAHILTSVATFFTSKLPNLRNVEVDEDKPHRDPAGFSFSTLDLVLKAACPGLPTFLSKAMPQCGVALGGDVPWSINKMKNDIRSVHKTAASHWLGLVRRDGGVWGGGGGVTRLAVHGAGLSTVRRRTKRKLLPRLPIM